MRQGAELGSRISASYLGHTPRVECTPAVLSYNTIQEFCTAFKLVHPCVVELRRLLVTVTAADFAAICERRPAAAPEKSALRSSQHRRSASHCFGGLTVHISAFRFHQLVPQTQEDAARDRDRHVVPKIGAAINASPDLQCWLFPHSQPDRDGPTTWVHRLDGVRETPPTAVPISVSTRLALQ